MSNTELIAELKQAAKRADYYYQTGERELFERAVEALEVAGKALVERTQQRDELFDLADKHLTERDTLIERIAATKVRLREIGATDTTVYDILTKPSVRP